MVFGLISMTCIRWLRGIKVFFDLLQTPSGVTSPRKESLAYWFMIGIIKYFIIKHTCFALLHHEKKLWLSTPFLPNDNREEDKS